MSLVHASVLLKKGALSKGLFASYNVGELRREFIKLSNTGDKNWRL